MTDTPTPAVSPGARDEIAERSATMPLITMDKKYKLRGYDYPVRVLCVDAKGRWPVVFLYETDGGERPGQARADGTTGLGPSSYDLIEVQEPVTFWLNVYPNREGGGFHAIGNFRAREAADAGAHTHRVACISATYDPNKA